MPETARSIAQQQARITALEAQVAAAAQQAPDHAPDQAPDHAPHCGGCSNGCSDSDTRGDCGGSGASFRFGAGAADYRCYSAPCRFRSRQRSRACRMARKAPLLHTSVSAMSTHEHGSPTRRDMSPPSAPPQRMGQPTLASWAPHTYRESETVREGAKRAEAARRYPTRNECLKQVSEVSPVWQVQCIRVI